MFIYPAPCGRTLHILLMTVSRASSTVDETHTLEPVSRSLDTNGADGASTQAEIPRDLEKGPAQEKDAPLSDADPSLAPSGAPSAMTKSRDPNIVEWDGPDDRTNPMNWPNSKKWRVMVMVSLFTLMRSVCISVCDPDCCVLTLKPLYSPLASSTVAPALPQIAEEFGLKPGSVLEAMTLSVFILAYAVGPLFLVSVCFLLKTMTWVLSSRIGSTI